VAALRRILALAAACTPSLAHAQWTERASVAGSGAQSNQNSYAPSISADGRFVAFWSVASNLITRDTNWSWDVFVHDRQLGTTKLVSVDSGGVQGDFHSYAPVLSADGRCVAFQSAAANLVAGDTNLYWDVFVRDLQLGITERVSVDSFGAEADASSDSAALSADGRFVAFSSPATNLVAGDTNGVADLFVHDRQLGTTERVSVDSAGAQADSASYAPSISADGRFVAFWSDASNLVAGDTNAFFDIFVRDLQTGTTERVSVDSAGSEANSESAEPSLSADGRFVAFVSDASNLVAGDTNLAIDIFVRDRLLGTTERVSVDSAGAQGNSDCNLPSISSDGRFVAFETGASNLCAGDTNVRMDVFVRDRQLGTTERVSVNPGGAQGDNSSQEASISADGRFVAFAGQATDLVAGDTNFMSDVFVRDRQVSIPGTDRCEPGVGGVLACPCSNPPGGPGRGCDNQAATGGATIASSGLSSLTYPTLSFTTTGENAKVFTILLQGTALTSGGIFGHGVRCVGTAKHLYGRFASGGSVTLPDLASDPAIPVRSSALGDTLLAGQTRWYQVYYRDRTQLLSGCPLVSSQLNTTIAQEVLWGP